MYKEEVERSNVKGYRFEQINLMEEGTTQCIVQRVFLKMGNRVSKREREISLVAGDLELHLLTRCKASVWVN